MSIVPPTGISVAGVNDTSALSLMPGESVFVLKTVLPVNEPANATTASCKSKNTQRRSKKTVFIIES